MQPDEIKIHDIKPLIPIEDYTLYFAIAGVIAILAVVALAGYMLLRRYRETKMLNRRQACMDTLTAVDLDDAKVAAYTITKLGRCFAEDSPRLQEAYENLSGRLEPYKFKKSVPDIDEETRAYYRVFLGMIDV